MKYARMDTERLVYEHDVIVENLRQVEERLPQHGIDARTERRVAEAHVLAHGSQAPPQSPALRLVRGDAMNAEGLTERFENETRAGPRCCLCSKKAHYVAFSGYYCDRHAKPSDKVVA